MGMKEIWFRRRKFGWGWEPATWQGWLIFGTWFVLVCMFLLTIDENATPRDVAFTFLLPTALLTAGLIRFCYAYGEKPRWQWGEDLGDPEKK